MISGTTNRLYTFHDKGMPKTVLTMQEQTILKSLQKIPTLPIEELNQRNFVRYQRLPDDYRVLATLIASPFGRQLPEILHL